MGVEGLNFVRFAPRGKDDFFEHVIKKVNGHFETQKQSQHANTEMWLKTGLMLSLYFIPYFFILAGAGDISTWLFYGLWLLMGLGMVGIGTAVMHDANHGAYSPNKKLNNFMSRTLDLIGGYSITWRIQHNVLHHTYTNIDGLDEDIDNIKLLRFSPRQPRYWYHRYQYLYAWFFYMLMTLFWMTAKDYVQVLRYKKYNLLAKQKVTLKKALFHISLYKLIYYTYVLVIPFLFLEIPWYHILCGFLLMHFAAGLFLSCIFQPAHIVETSDFEKPTNNDGQSRIENSWAIHSVINTTNFAQNNRLLSWFIGGLNFQIVHHLFPGICHVHYPKIAPIVMEACRSYNIPYNLEPSFRRALLNHADMLKKLGRD